MTELLNTARVDILITCCHSRCRQEVDSVLGSRSEVAPEDITKLKYIGAVFKEALRLYPPGAIVGRLVTEEMTINGLKIPVDTPMFVRINQCILAV